MNATARLVLSYVAPGGGAQTLNLSTAIEYVGSATGFVDIPEATADGISFAVPFGTVASAKAVIIQNNTNQTLELAINGSEDLVVLGAGDVFGAFGPAATGVTSLSVITTGLTTADGTVAFVVLGDSATP